METDGILKNLNEDTDGWQIRCKNCDTFNSEFMEECSCCGEKITKDIPDDN